jgi:hypothetical protein
MLATLSRTPWTRLGSDVTSWASWSKSSWPKTTTNRTVSTRKVSITRPVARPRFMCRESGPTAGSIATDANHDMSTVKNTAPPSPMTKPKNVAMASSAMTTQPTFHTLRGESSTTR